MGFERLEGSNMPRVSENSHGATGQIAQTELESQVVFDDMLFHVFPNKLWDGIYPFRVWTAHYFYRGREVAYWNNCINAGFIFEEPRCWDPTMKAQLSRDQSTPSHN